jgi:Tfp pilus assembly protein PilF
MLANLHMGFTYLKEGDMERAMAYLETARAQQPAFADTYKFLGHAFAAQGKNQEAMKNLSFYLELQPNALDAPNQRRFIEELRARIQRTPQSSS